MKKLFFAILTLSPIVLLAQTVPPVVDPNADFFQAVMDFIKNFGGMSAMLKVSGAILLIVASMKVSFLKPLYDKLGAFKSWLAPILGLIAGTVGIGFSGPVSLASIFAYVTAGAGAVFIHEILDTVKAIPGLGAIYVSAINFIEGLLGSPKA